MQLQRSAGDYHSVLQQLPLAHAVVDGATAFDGVQPGISIGRRKGRRRFANDSKAVATWQCVAVVAARITLVLAMEAKASAPTAVKALVSVPCLASSSQSAT